MKRKQKKLGSKVTALTVAAKTKISAKTTKRDQGDTLPQITTESLAEHREEVLRGARKLIYPLTHSKHRIVVISVSLITFALLSFLTICLLALYRYQSSSEFMYRITKVIPFPVARIGGTFVPYEQYLFELRHYIHYYETQEKLDFKTEAGKLQLTDYRQRSLDKVMNDTYVRKIAREKSVTVSEAEVDAQIELLRQQNRLGGGNEVFEDVLKDFWGWSLDDFRRSLRQELLQQKLLPLLDTETRQNADAVVAELRAGADFAAKASAVSADPDSAARGGEYAELLQRTSADVDPAVLAALFALQPGTISDPIALGYGIEIVKLIELNDGKAKAAHILLPYKDIGNFLNDYKEAQPAQVLIKNL